MMSLNLLGHPAGGRHVDEARHLGGPFLEAPQRRGCANHAVAYLPGLLCSIDRSEQVEAISRILSPLSEAELELGLGQMDKAGRAHAAMVPPPPPLLRHLIHPSPLPPRRDRLRPEAPRRHGVH